MRVAIRYAAGSDVGRTRENNEDSAYAGPWLLAVADGMGGHVGGEIASSLAVQTLAPTDAEVPQPALVDTLEHAVLSANQAIAQRVAQEPALQSMGTTCTAMLWSGTQLALAHIGDSRAYMLRDTILYQITEDHTLEKMLTGEDGAAPHLANRLVRVLDGKPDRKPDMSLRESLPGDRYLLCSDGLTGPVDAETLHQVLTTQSEPEAAVRALIDLANQGGGPDNITVIVVDVVPEGADARPPVVVGAAQR
ncbi:protein phosphatase 2C domain-containing protein [Actinoallomurus sp. NPDC052274]|uniref:PP2C family protein-serine/threonine phosphatase n=1 Tax=Actinoallomurus sp. NPDC052274 TaxID=3155420 RepID=UPI003435EDEC